METSVPNGWSGEDERGPPPPSSLLKCLTVLRGHQSSLAIYEKTPPHPPPPKITKIPNSMHSIATENHSELLFL